MIEELTEFVLIGFNKYYGLDWLAMIITVLSISFLEKRNIYGFVFGAVACLCWLAFNFLAESSAGVIANLFFILMHVKAYKTWKKEEIKN